MVIEAGVEWPNKLQAAFTPFFFSCMEGKPIVLTC